MPLLFYFFGEYRTLPSFTRKRESELVRMETCIPSFPRMIPSFPRSVNPVLWVSAVLYCFATLVRSFPRKWESKTQNLKKPFYSIIFCTDRPRFPPARDRRIHPYGNLYSTSFVSKVVIRYSLLGCRFCSFGFACF